MVKKHESIAITGESSCGKTTLLKILLGILEPESGQIFVGGRPIGEVGKENYRRSIATVLQDDNLFSGSISENISFFDQHADVSHVEFCANLASVHDDICRLPAGYNTIIGANGGALSGGQIQRLLLARALYKRPTWLFLDEATSHLDASRENSIVSNLKQLEISRIVIAHQLETLALVEKVYVLDNGLLTRLSEGEQAEM